MQIPINRPAQMSLNPFEKTVLEVYNRYGCDAFETSKALRLPSHEVKNTIAEIRAKGHDDLIGGIDMARGQRTPPEVVEKVRELHESGKTQAEIIQEIDLPKSTVSYLIKKFTGGATAPKPEESISDVKVNMEKMIANHCRCEDFTPAPEPSEDDKLPPYPTDEERKAYTERSVRGRIIDHGPFGEIEESLKPPPLTPTTVKDPNPDKIGFRIENALVMLLQACVKIPEALAVPKECVEITALHASTDAYSEASIELTIAGTRYCLRFYESV